MGEKISLNRDWKFYDEKNNSISRVDLPHTFASTPLHYFDESVYQKVGVYEREFTMPEEWKGMQVYLNVDGAAHKLTVKVNGKECGEHHNGYTKYRLDLTELLEVGSNTLQLVVDSRENLNQPPFGHVIDYMTYGGIYREVYLEVVNRLHTESVFVETKRRDSSNYELVITHSTRQTKQKILLDLNYRVMDDNLLISEWTETVDSMEGTYPIHMNVSGITEWSIDVPKLYRLEVRVMKQEQVFDYCEEYFGFRETEFRADGFYLNGKKIKLRGLNRHQSYAYMGYAMPASMQKLDADILKKELGLNAVRTSHYPQSHDFIRRCDELGLMVFTEIPGWQHIGDEEWQEIALENVREMVEQYRNHPSIILWGVRINESKDCDELYEKTNALARKLDPGRATGGVRAMAKSHLLEDVYTYNDFSHTGENAGCSPKSKISSNMNQAYLVSEYNGHMYPTKSFDCEENRRDHMLRHARVINDVAAQSDIAGSFGWCMFDYNTHRDFGSGDRICYHGVMDMFRNPKLASYVYACEGDLEEVILELSSSMDIGEHPASNRGPTYILTNADSVKMYKNDIFIKEYFAKDSPYKNLKHGPILIDDFVGNQVYQEENFKKNQARIITQGLNHTAVHGYAKYPLPMMADFLKCMLFYHMKIEDAVGLFNKYIGDWGGTATTYRFEAIKNGEVVKTLIKGPVESLHLETRASSSQLVEKDTYDVVEIRIRMLDQNGNLLHFYNDPLKVEVSGPLELLGPDIFSLEGGMGGIYLRSKGESGSAKVCISACRQKASEKDCLENILDFDILCK